MPKVKTKRRQGLESASVSKKIRTIERTSKVMVSNGEFAEHQCKLWFSQYAEGEEIGPEGVEKLCLDLAVEPEDVVMLVISWQMRADRMGYFTWLEWLEGMKKLGCSQVEDLRKKLNDVREKLDDPVVFKEVYKFSFDFTKDRDQRSMELEVAISLLEVLLGSRQWSLLSDLVTYLKSQSHYKVVNRDQWMNILEFSRTISNDLHNYDLNGAWPVLLDEFVEWYQLLPQKQCTKQLNCAQ